MKFVLLNTNKSKFDQVMQVTPNNNILVQNGVLVHLSVPTRVQNLVINFAVYEKQILGKFFRQIEQVLVTF